ncbi:ketoacyl-ACP synthase III [Nocardia sp. BMG51109]|uniref:ketoacyl-ACP synthase III n=1 Tax=Nocardia sp. BMG51109 TaxID=1056816 RepID=UPI0004AE430C|nr:ketoacyl-ACP synthase III [Nocardia sp. BMG51109]
MSAPDRDRDTVALTAIGTHLPARRVSNRPLAAGLNVSREFLDTRIGIGARAVKEPEQRTSDLCLEAFDDLIRHTPVDLDAVRLLCVITQNPDQRIPHTAAIVHDKLGLAEHCMTFDLSQGCAGYAHGLTVTTALADRLGFGHALLFTCDPYTPIVDPGDRNTALLFGDAATVSYLATGADGYRVLDADFGTAPGTTNVLSCDTGYLAMDGRGVLLNAARTVPGSLRRVLGRNALGLGDIDLILAHPGSRRIIETLREELAVDEKLLPFEIADYGNTVSSSIPLALAPRLRENPPLTTLLAGFGVGFSWGTCLLRYSADTDHTGSNT